MAPLVVQLVATLVARIRLPWRDAVRVGLAVMFLFTAASHFSSMKTEFAAMIPPPLTGALWLVYLTGLLEAAGAIGLLVQRTKRPAAICLALLLIAMFPANAYAALNGITFRGEPAASLWWRAPLQLLWLIALWWSTLAQPRAVHSGDAPAPILS